MGGELGVGCGGGGGGGVTVIPFGLSTFDTCASDRVIQWYLIDRHGRRVWVMVKWHGKGAGYGVKGKGGAGNGTQGPLVGGGGGGGTLQLLLRVFSIPSLCTRHIKHLRVYDFLDMPAP